MEVLATLSLYAGTIELMLLAVAKWSPPVISEDDSPAYHQIGATWGFYDPRGED